MGLLYHIHLLMILRGVAQTYHLTFDEVLINLETARNTMRDNDMRSL